MKIIKPGTVRTYQYSVPATGNVPEIQFPYVPPGDMAILVIGQLGYSAEDRSVVTLVLLGDDVEIGDMAAAVEELNDQSGDDRGGA